MTKYVLENQRHRIDASIEAKEKDSLWVCKISLSTLGTRESTTRAKGFLHLPVAINDALQFLDERAASLPDAERQVITLWLRQTNRQAWAGITDEQRDLMYQEEHKFRLGRK